MCQLHCDAHKRSKNSKAHGMVVGIQESTTDAASGNLLAMCAAHPGHPLTQYCVECDQLVCTRCSLLQHQNHQHDGIRTASRCFREEMLPLLETARRVMEADAKNVSAVQAMASEVTAACASQVDLLHAYFDHLCELIRAREVKLEMDISTLTESRLGVLQHQQQELAVRMANAQHTCDEAQHLVEQADDFRVLESKKLLRRQLTMIAKQLPQAQARQPACDADFGIHCDGDLCDLLRAYGQVQPQSTVSNESKCSSSKLQLCSICSSTV